jgi:hypothetical protein
MRPRPSTAQAPQPPEMATALRDLLSAVTAETRTPGWSQVRADDAAGGIGAAGRALGFLVPDGIDAMPGGVHDSAVHSSQSACHAVAEGWAGVATGRITDLMQAAADLVGLLRGEMTRSDRWAAAVAIANVAQRCAGAAQQHAPYAGTPQLKRVAGAGAVLRQMATDDLPSKSRTILDRPAPAVGLPAGLDMHTVAAESTIAMCARLHVATRRAGTGIALSEAAAVTHVAQSLMLLKASLATIDGVDVSPWRASTKQWGEVRSELALLGGGPQPSAAVGSLLHWAQRASISLDAARETVASGKLNPNELRDLRGASELMRAQLPEAVQDLRDARLQWQHSGALFIRARDVELGESPPPSLVSAYIADEAVRVGSSELQPLGQALRLRDLKPGQATVGSRTLSSAAASAATRDSSDAAAGRSTEARRQPLGPPVTTTPRR